MISLSAVVKALLELGLTTDSLWIEAGGEVVIRRPGSGPTRYPSLMAFVEDVRVRMTPDQTERDRIWNTLLEAHRRKQASARGRED